MHIAKEDDLKSKVTQGLKWLSIGKFLGQFINWALTFIIIRLLEPSDYGVMAMATIFLSLLGLLNEMGLGAAIVQKKDLEENLIKKIFGMVIILNFFLFILLFLISPLIASFFNEPLLVPIIRVLSTQFFFMAFILIPKSLQDRNMDFKRRSILDLFANLAGGLVAVYLAWTGFGVWALVWPSIMILAIQTIGYNIITPFLIMPAFNFNGMGKVFAFGGYITIEKVLWYFYAEADKLIIGKLLGKELLGFYSIGKEVAMLPLQKIMPIVNQIAFPTFSRIQDDKNKIVSYTLLCILIISSFAFPVFFGISSISNELVSVVLGAKWGIAVTPMIFISVVLPLRMLNSILLNILRSLGRADISFQNNLILSVVMVAGFLGGSQWGINGVSLVWPILFPLCFLTINIRSSNIIGVTLRQIFKIVYKFLFSSIAMFFIVKAMRSFFIDIFSPQILMCWLIFIGAVFYISLQFLFCRKELHQVVNLFTK